MNLYHALSKFAGVMFLSVTSTMLMNAPMAQATSLIWDNNAGTFNWSTAGGDTNWNAGANTFTTGGVDDVSFNGAGAGTINISANMDPISTTVSGANNYTFTGGPISGSGALNKSGSGILQLDSTNTFSGGVVFGGGEIAFHAGNNLGSNTAPFSVTEDSTLNFNPGGNTGTTVGNTVTIDATKTFTLTRANGQHFPNYTGIITGDGALRIEGSTANYWRLSNPANDFSGGLTIASGVIIQGDGAFGNNPIVDIESGSTFTATGGTTGVGRTLNLVSGTSTVGSSGSEFIATITGAGVLRANNLWLNNASNNYTSTSMGGIANGTLRVGVAGSLGSGAVAFDSNPNNRIFFMDPTGGTFNNTLNMSSGTRTFRVDQAGAVIQYDGAINATGAITLEGPGTFAVTNWNSTNTLSVTEGTFLLNDPTTTNLSDITVDVGAAFGGNGTATMGASQSLTVNGSLEPGNNAAGTLTVNGALNLSSTSILDFELGPGGIVGGGVNDLVQVNGDLVLDGTLQVSDLGGFGGPGAVYRLFNYSGSLTDNGLELSGLNGAFLDFSTLGQVNLIAPIPEPATVWLLGCSLLLCGRRLRRKQA